MTVSIPISMGWGQDEYNILLFGQSPGGGCHGHMLKKFSSEKFLTIDHNQRISGCQLPSQIFDH